MATTDDEEASNFKDARAALRPVPTLERVRPQRPLPRYNGRSFLRLGWLSSSRRVSSVCTACLAVRASASAYDSTTLDQFDAIMWTSCSGNPGCILAAS